MNSRLSAVLPVASLDLNRQYRAKREHYAGNADGRTHLDERPASEHGLMFTDDTQQTN